MIGECLDAHHPEFSADRVLRTGTFRSFSGSRTMAITATTAATSTSMTILMC